MRTTIKVCLISTLVLFAACSSWAADENKQGYLWLAKTSGSWSDSDKFGYYRAMLYRYSGESGSSDSVVIEILEQDKAGQRSVKKTIDLDVASYRGYIQDISFKKIDEKLMAVLLDIEMNGMDGVVLREVFLVSYDGSFGRIVEAKYQNIYGSEQIKGVGDK